MSTTTETNGDVKGAPRKFINTSLISLKCLLFFFFGGMGCLLPFLPLHMLSVGLSDEEIRLISAISPLVAILGPLVAGPLADRAAASRLRLATEKQQQQQQDHGNSNGLLVNPGGHASGNGRYLRVMIAVCCVFGALFYSLLLVVPRVERVDLPRLRPGVRFSCDEDGAILHQERCKEAIGCHRWTNEDLVGRIQLQRCRYACYPLDERRRRVKYPPAQSESLVGGDGAPGEPPAASGPFEPVLEDDPAVQVAAADDESSGDAPSGVIPLGESWTPSSTTTTEAAPSNDLDDEIFRDARAGENSRWNGQPRVELPHVCYEDSLGRTVCHVFETHGPGRALSVNVSLHQALNPEDNDDWCAYPVLGRGLKCRVPSKLGLAVARTNRTCLVECDIDDPYDLDFVEDNVLAESQCRQVNGNEQLTFWMYLAIRCLADIFPTAAIALIGTAVVIATRETSSGRGDVGRQLAFGSLGLAAFGPLSGYLAVLLRTTSLAQAYSYAPILLHGVLVLVAACVALTANRMPLGPPEWWWHTRSGMLALPMSAVRKYGAETVALFLVLVLLGAFWSVMDSYLSIHLERLKGDELSIGVALTVGALPAVVFLWKSEHLVDYCGHSNLLITAFIMYILRFTGLSLVPNVWWALISESLELFTLEIMWVTAILYFRHLIPRQMTATGQALPVIAHFCIGRAIGAVIGASVDRINRGDEIEAMRFIYQCMAIAAAVIASVYFVLYHGVLKPRCHAQNVQNGQRQPPTLVQAINGNGNYTPLRVYHNGMGRKGQFRY